MKTALHYTVNMMQNVTQNRLDKKLTKQDCINIHKAWLLNLFSAPHNTPQLFSPFMPSTSIILVVGTGNNRCKVMWTAFVDGRNYNAISLTTNNKKGSALIGATSCSLNGTYGHNEKIGQEVISTNLYSNLNIKQGEIKVIIELAMFCFSSDPKPISSYFGLKMLKLHRLNTRKNRGSYLIEYIIFSPKIGIFDTEVYPK